MKEVIKKLLRERLNNDDILHYLDEKKLINILTKNEIKPRWKHYIGNRMIVGTSMTWDTAHSTIINMDYQIRLILNRKLLEQDYKTYLINGNRTHLQTLAMKGNFDPTAYEFESTEPNELFVEGIIRPLSKYIVNIEILKPISDNTKILISKFLTIGSTGM